MRARDVMSRPVVVVDTGATVREATVILADNGFAAVPVVDEFGRVVGMFGESDALRADAARDLPVTVAMAWPVEVVGPGTDVGVIAERMLATHLRSLPVVEDGAPIGVVSRRDLVRGLVRDDDVVRMKLCRLLGDYAGSRRHWTVEVTDGDVAISGAFLDEAERDVVAALARTVPGVDLVRLTVTAGAGIGWDD